MITQKDIIAMARHVTRRGRGIPDRKLMHAYREWYIGLALCVCVIAGGVIYNTLQFRYYASLEDRISGSATTTVEYRHGVVDRVLETYEERQAVFEAEGQEVPNVPIQTEQSAGEDSSPAGPPQLE